MGRKVVSKDRLQMAERLRELREQSGFTQENFSEILEISLSAYKKIESGENQISLDGLRLLQKKIGISSDFLIFGVNRDGEDLWQQMQNCSEEDKMRILVRLLLYFTETKKTVYQSREDQKRDMHEISKILKEIMADEKKI